RPDAVRLAPHPRARHDPVRAARERAAGAPRAAVTGGAARAERAGRPGGRGCRSALRTLGRARRPRDGRAPAGRAPPADGRAPDGGPRAGAVAVGGRIVVVGLGPGDADLVVPAARRALEQSSNRYVRTTRHPAVADLAGAGLALRSFDDEYD